MLKNRSKLPCGRVFSGLKVPYEPILTKKPPRGHLHVSDSAYELPYDLMHSCTICIQRVWGFDYVLSTNYNHLENVSGKID
jgi:hypothetical protein